MAKHSLSSQVKHVLHCLCLVSWILAFCYATGAIRFGPDPIDTLDPWTEYGFATTLVIYALRLIGFLALPQTLCNFVGLVRFNAFPEKVQLKSSPLLAPFMCVRVVTRGLYPRLVHETVTKNLQTLQDVGIENFIIQVVTDTAINVSHSPRVRELVVPSSYRPKSGALNKSRALQYCLEDENNFLDDGDWIVHLDEETLLTENSVRGILNFITDGKHQFGQGLITYANSPVHFKSVVRFIQNRICTVADSFRVCDDMGKLRCQLKIFHKPFFGWKGSYVVSQAGSERKVSFDNGPEGSTAEDCYFAIAALDQGYSFDFIEGEMWEKSPFSFSDFFKQRKRWMQGIFMVVASRLIPLRAKTILGISLASWLTMPLSTSNLVLTKVYPVSMHPVFDLGLAFLGAMGLYSYAFGYLKQHPVHRFSWLRLLVAIPEIVLASTLSIVVENLAVLSMWGGNWYEFYIVEKEVDADEAAVQLV